jgi:nitrogen fixation protein FixH
MMTDAQPGYRVKGWHVLAIIVAFFGVVFTVNAIFITTALNTFPGEETRRSYVQGRDYNQVVDARRAQEALGWSATANLTEERVLIEVRDADGQPVTGLRLEGVLQHPASMSYDRDLVFTEVRDGVYAAGVCDLPIGRWTLSAEAMGEQPFALETRLWRR